MEEFKTFVETITDRKDAIRICSLLMDKFNVCQLERYRNKPDGCKIRINFYYLVIVWDDVEPELAGPFESEEDRDAHALSIRDKEGPEHGIYPLDLSDDQPVIGAYPGAFFN